jgi:hypothetical protein
MTLASEASEHRMPSPRWRRQRPANANTNRCVGAIPGRLAIGSGGAMLRSGEPAIQSKQIAVRGARQVPRSQSQQVDALGAIAAGSQSSPRGACLRLAHLDATASTSSWVSAWNVPRTSPTASRISLLPDDGGHGGASPTCPGSGALGTFLTPECTTFCPPYRVEEARPWRSSRRFAPSNRRAWSRWHRPSSSEILHNLVLKAEDRRWASEIGRLSMLGELTARQTSAAYHVGEIYGRFE